MKKRNTLLIVGMAILLGSCRIGSGKMTDRKEEISVLRYDKLLGEYVRSNSFSAMQKITMDYQLPTKILIEDVLAIGTVDGDTIAQRLQHFYSDTTLLRLLNDVDHKFPDLEEVEKGLTKGFGKLKKEVPDTQVPFIYSQVSAFNESIVLIDTLLGISLDKYMEKIIRFTNVFITTISVVPCVPSGLCPIVWYSIFSAVTGWSIVKVLASSIG